MKKIALTSVIIISLVLTICAYADQTNKKIETIPDVSLSDLIQNLALETQWGNVYFNIRDMHYLINAAAKLRPIDLGTFVTDKNKLVRVKALAYSAGKVTFDVVFYGPAPQQAQ